MKNSFWILSTLCVAFLGAGSVSLADDPPASSGDDGGEKVKAMFKEGEYKCTDGYDPDTDPSLHPAGQNPRTRALVNAQAKEEHEKQIIEKAATPTKDAAHSDSKSTPVKIDKIDDKDAAAKKEADEKNEKEKEKEKEKAEKDKEKDKEKEKAGQSKIDEKAASNPLNQAMYAMGTKHYQNSIDVLKPLIAKDPKNAQAHYLMAASLVGLRKYTDASAEYNEVLKLAPAGSKLHDMAEKGLKIISK